MIEPDWTRLSHGLGRADDLPDILDKLSPDPSSPVWGDLWDRVCHQGTTYPASPYVLPRLLEAAKSWVSSGRVMPLVLAADIVASREFDIHGFETTVEDLSGLTRETASADGLSRADRIYLLSSAITFGGDRFWGPALIHLHDEEFPGCCTFCEMRLFLTIGTKGSFVSNGDPISDPGRVEAIVPCSSAELPGNISWAHQIVQDVGDEELARRIRCVLGQSICPDCDAQFKVSESIQRFELG